MKAGRQAVAYEAARETLQIAARTLRSISDAASGQPALVNAAAELESIFDRLYVVEDLPQTRRSQS